MERIYIPFNGDYTEIICNERGNKTMENKDNVNVTTKNHNELGRCVYVPCLARQLLHMGYDIIDIKPNRVNSARTVFVFKYTDDIDNVLRDLIAKAKERRESNETKTEVNEMVRNTFLDSKE